jgi:hypothetical protein
VLLIGVLLLSSIGCIKETKKEKKEESSPEKVKIPVSQWKWFENEKAGYKLKCPASWEGGGYYSRYSFKAPEEEWHDAIIWLHADPRSSVPLLEQAEYWVDEDKVEEWKNITLGGEKALEVTFITTVNRNRVTDVWVIHGEKEYNIAFVLGPPYSTEDISKWIDLVEEIKDSFRFI